MGRGSKIMQDGYQRPIEPATTNVTESKVGMVLGIISLVITVLAMMICWIPFLNLIVPLMIFISGVLAIIGIVVASSKKEMGIGWPISGCLLSIISTFVMIIISIFIGGFFSILGNEIKSQIEESEHISSGSPARESTTAATESAEQEPQIERKSWTPVNRAVVLNDISVSIIDAVIGQVKSYNSSGREYFTDAELLVVTVQLTNVSETRRIEYHTWGGVNRYDEVATRLTDNYDNYYKWLYLDNYTTPEGRVNEFTLNPDVTITDVLIFEKPIDVAETMYLELPGVNIGSSDWLRFEIPSSFYQ